MEQRRRQLEWRLLGRWIERWRRCQLAFLMHRSAGRLRKPAGVYGRRRIWPGASGTPAKKAEYMMPLASWADLSDPSEIFSGVF